MITTLWKYAGIINKKEKDMIKKKEWQDISHETLRTYRFTDGNTVAITRPLWLYISDSGHRVIDDNGTHHYIPAGWFHLMWDGGTQIPGEKPEVEEFKKKDGPVSDKPFEVKGEINPLSPLVPKEPRNQPYTVRLQ